MSESAASLVNSVVISIFGAGLVFISTLYWTQKQQAAKKAEGLAEEHEKVLKRVSTLETQLALVTQAVVPISTAFQAILIKELTRYQAEEMDNLMVKVGPPNVLSEEEEIRLIKLLKIRVNEMSEGVTDSERGAAYILPAVMERAKQEQAILSSVADLAGQLILVPALVKIRAGTQAEHASQPGDATEGAPK